MTSPRFVTTPRALLLARTAQTFSQRPSSLLGLTAPRVALDLDQALAARLFLDRRDQERIAAGGPFARLDAVLAGRGPRHDEQGLRYEDPRAVYREVMAARQREGLVH